MNITEKIFALNQIETFSSLQYSELILIAEVTSEYHYQPEKVIVPSGTILQKLYIVVDGKVITQEHQQSIPIFGVNSLILEEAIPYDLIADKALGATVLSISKGHFFTIINECPNVVINFLKINVL
jgi:signal-transduction protein with cAMP-binding, CBS, and nucleotidyltransferase domain